MTGSRPSRRSGWRAAASGRRVLTFASALLAAAVVGAAAPGPPWRWTAEAIADVTSVLEARLAPDGRSVVFASTRWCPDRGPAALVCSNLWQFGIVEGSLHRLTTGDTVDVQPHGGFRRVAFLSRPPGALEGPGKLWGTGGLRPAPMSRGDVVAFEWSPDGRRIASLRHETAGDALWLHQVNGAGTSRLSSQGKLSVGAFGWSPDSRSLVAVVGRGDRSSLRDLVELSLTGPPRSIAIAPGPVGSVAWSPDRATISWIGREANGTTAAYTVPSGGGLPRRLAPDAGAEVTGMAWTGDNRLGLSIAAGLQTRVELRAPSTGVTEVVLARGVAVAAGSLSWARSAEPYALVASSSDHADEVFVGMLPRPMPAIKDTVGAPPPPFRKVTFSNRQLDGLPRGAQTITRYPLGDGTESDALFVDSVTPTAEARPLVVVIQDCPGMPLQDGWLSAYWRPTHAFSERGAAVLLISPRAPPGSASRLLEIRAGIDAMVRTRHADSSHVGLLLATDGPLSGTTMESLRGLLRKDGQQPAVVHAECGLTTRSGQIETASRLLRWMETEVVGSRSMDR